MKSKKNKVLIFFICIAFAILLNSRSYATDLDEIESYIVTVDPRMNDGSLDITYEITWKVLDSTTEGPLSWVEIGTANSNFDSLRAKSSNIKQIAASSGSYVRIDFDRKYYEGEELTFKYSLHQSYMYKISGTKCKYSFTPAWFKDAKIKYMTIRWNNDGILTSNKKSTDDGYYVWTKTNMSKGQKMTANVTYRKEAFSNLNQYKQISNVRKDQMGMSTFDSLYLIIFLIIVVAIVIDVLNKGNYYSHSGFGGGYYHHHHYHGGGCVHSSCACVSSCACANSCACACAGSGRAGCSKKDFYGTKVNYKMLMAFSESDSKKANKK